MQKKEITIIICSYNNSRYLQKCLSSIYNQSVSINKFNVILVDDKSTDNSLEIVNNFKKKSNLRIIKNKKNIGLVKSCNKAIKQSSNQAIKQSGMSPIPALVPRGYPRRMKPSSETVTSWQLDEPSITSAHHSSAHLRRRRRQQLA